MKHMSLLLLIGSMALAWTNMMLFETDNYSYPKEKLIGDRAHETKQMMDRIIREVINEGKIHLIDELVAEDYVAKSLGDESFRFEGREVLKRSILNMHFRFPNYSLTLDDYIAYDERFVFYWPGGDILEGGIPLPDPNAAPGYYGISIHRFEDGVLKESFFMRCNLTEIDTHPTIGERDAPYDIIRNW